jgi:predicted FMN-binding regulatory protein PaiB
MEGIIGFEMHIEALEGKFKLGQSWSNKDRQSALAQLRRAAGR